MNYDRYENLKFSEDYLYFLFYSDGRNGRLKKLVMYAPLENRSDIYNLSLGTVRIDQNGIEYLDGTEISDNGDRDKILATVAFTALAFIHKYPDKTIYLTGFNAVRTRLYQIAINHAYEELSTNFLIYGDTSADADLSNLCPLTTGINYTGFLVKKRW